jgi:hypothetical protein
MIAAPRLLPRKAGEGATARDPTSSRAVAAIHRCYDHVTRRTDPAFARPERYATLRMSRFETAAITTAES